ncbi:hypothetical protein [Capnocytophaga ochracea]|uniref:Uncharacterized protein n=1 Tax=Capnocytophaga ochracea TaxID=1018 RepID=A0A2X2T4B8_CAPOC|nr:hypothetical protein [Capnocytophaga ochracea]SQA93975.1 Uncharacterised protein [Capnocytophaga ochracea]
MVIKFILQSKSDNAPIYVRLIISRDKDYKCKTGLYIALNSGAWQSNCQRLLQ